MEEIKKEGKNWGIVSVWNEQLTFGRGQRKLEKRDRIWASEIGKNHYERWLKMNAIKPDFDFDERTLRVFEAGKFFERIIGFVLISSGLLKADNKWYNIPADKDHLEVSVKPDFIAGGKPDWDRVKENVSEELLFKVMPNLGRIAESLVKNLSERYPEGLRKLVFEIKSINSQVFWSKKDYLQEAYPHHVMQLLTGMKATGIEEGRLTYISKDDLTIAEFSISLNNEKLNNLWEDDVRKLTKYVRENIEPPKPENVIFDPRKKLRFQHNKEKRVIKGCYVNNWEIGWSNYISRITGLKGKEQKGVAERWKRSNKDRLIAKNSELKDEFKAKIK